MNVVDSKDGRVTVVVAEGRLDGTTSAEFQRRLSGLLSEPGSRMVVDFAGVEFVSSAGLRALLGILKKVKATQGLIAICSVRDPVREVLEIAGLTSMLPLHQERVAAIVSVQ